MNCARSDRQCGASGACRSPFKLGLKLMVLAAVVASGMMFLTGCSDDVAGPGSPTGYYELAQVDDKKMPATFTDAVGNKLMFFEGFLEMEDDGTFELDVEGRLNAIEFDFEYIGTYEISGKTVTLTDTYYGDVIMGRMEKGRIVVEYPIAGVKKDLYLEQP